MQSYTVDMSSHKSRVERYNYNSCTFDCLLSKELGFKLLLKKIVISRIQVNLTKKAHQKGGINNTKIELYIHKIIIIISVYMTVLISPTLLHVGVPWNFDVCGGYIHTITM